MINVAKEIEKMEGFLNVRELDTNTYIGTCPVSKMDWTIKFHETPKYGKNTYSLYQGREAWLLVRDNEVLYI